MHAVNLSGMTDRYQFSAAARSRAWDWLFALRKRLNVDLQLVDDAQAPLLGESGGAAVDFLLSEEGTNVRLAVATAIRTRTPQVAAVDRVQAVIVPVTLDREVSGALIVARRIADNQSLDDGRHQLELVGFWLTNAVEAHLQSPPAAQGDLDRLSALTRLLADDSIQKSDRQIVNALVETLAVWHDLEAYGYIETIDGDFTRDVTLPGSDLSRTPTAIPGGGLPELDEVTRLERSDIDRIGFRGGEDVAVARLGEGPGSWLFAVTGSIGADELQRLSLYVALMEQAIARTTQTTIAEVVAALSTQLLADSANPDEQAREAVRTAQRALDITSVALTVTSRTGAALLHVGSSFTAAELAAGSGAGKVVIIRRDPRSYAMAFVADWSPDHRVTQLESRVTETIADLLEAWVQRLVRQSARTADRRAPHRGFDEVLERLARDAVQGGIPVTVVVISLGDVELQSDLAQTRILRLRQHLRGGDLVGRLDAGDVGVLLYDTVGQQADAPIARLRHQLEVEGVPVEEMSIGMASRRPGDPVTRALAQEARQGARYHGSDN
jgi:hypothetical protein